MISRILYYFEKPDKAQNVSSKLVYLLWIVRIFTIAFGTYQIFFGETLIGFTIVACAIFVITPSIITFDRFKKFPIEIELIFFLMVTLQYIIGESQQFYVNIPYYDKFVHIVLPLFTGYLGFLISYTLYFSDRLRVSPSTMVIFVIFATLGIGAAWEIIEYTNDIFIYPNVQNWHKFQGNQMEGPYEDTINDLVADLFGGIIGALLALKYTWKKERKNQRLREILHELSEQLFRKKNR